MKKKSFILLLALFFLPFVINPVWITASELNTLDLSSPKLSKENPHSLISLETIDKDSPLLERTIKEILDIQYSLIIDPFDQPLPENFENDGFILVKMTPDYVRSLITESNASIIAAYEGINMVGYILLTEIDEFYDLYSYPDIGMLELPFPKKNLESFLNEKKVMYIEQISIKPGFSKRGIGTLLVNECKRQSPYGLVADVFIEPITNRPSLAFFSQKGFQKIGILHQEPRNGFFRHKTQVFFWSPHWFSENNMN